MLGRRDVLVASMAAMVPALPVPAFGERTSLPQLNGEFLHRPGCKIYYETAGSGPALIFVHGLGSNHITWWQQVPYFANRYTCITFSHRGFPPSSEIGVPDPKEFSADLASLIEHLQLPDVRLIAQSMGGWTSLEYMLSYPNHKVRALVLASTCGTIHQPSVPLLEPQRLTDWTRRAAAARADMARRGISPAAGERMARERPMLHFLYRTIANASGAFDREQLRTRLEAISTRPAGVLHGLSTPTLFIIGSEDTTYPFFLSEALAGLMPKAKVDLVPESGHSVYFQRAETFNELVDRFLAGIG
jgi:3-oxoadipate enol-lactonase